MERIDIISVIGRDFLKSNTENGEFDYSKALKELNKSINTSLVSHNGRTFERIDLRFVKDNISILIETKKNFNDNDEVQLRAYVEYEKVLTDNLIIAILANTTDDRIKVWYGKNIIIDESHKLSGQYTLKSFEEYADLYIGKTNNKEKVVKNTYLLNEKLHKYGINEKLRSQFVGTCLLALKQNLKYKSLSTSQIISGIKEIVESMLEQDINKAKKITSINDKVLTVQDIKKLPSIEFEDILNDINTNILPFINDKNTMGQDLLNLFFTTFNKYVGKADKNQAFTPDHIVRFMCKVIGINRNSVVLDPCCGSGSFLVRALTEALDDCSNKKEESEVKKNNIYGIEYEDVAFGLSTTNMLIHGDGNSNIQQGNCFDELILNDSDWDKIDVVLMNPPYNAQKKHCYGKYVENLFFTDKELRETGNNQKKSKKQLHWKSDTKTDPSKGFHFVYYIASKVKKGKLAVLLPTQCAIGGKSKEINAFKELMLQEHTLDAVFSLPSDIFHPGASASSCCMVFTLGERHKDKDGNVKKDTFLGYFKDDGFIKKKNIGRVERVEGGWADKEAEWLDLYQNSKIEKGITISKKLTEKDEWLAEAYMETDYSILNNNEERFMQTVRDFLSFKIRNRSYIELFKNNIKLSKFEDKKKVRLPNVNKWKEFYVGKLFVIEPAKGTTTDELLEGNEIPYIAAKKDSNGFQMMCERNDDFISKGNAIVFIQIGEGSAGYSLYQDDEFIGMNGKIACGYNENLDKYNGLFISTVLDLERYRYSFGRSWSGNRLYETKILLPAKLNKKTAEYEPDWKLMTRYIRSLDYGDLI
ncbi:TPA: N-6 DNA methylase [Mannheimia haemolytica]